MRPGRSGTITEVTFGKRHQHAGAVHGNVPQGWVSTAKISPADAANRPLHLKPFWHAPIVGSPEAAAHTAADLKPCAEPPNWRGPRQGSAIAGEAP